MRAVLFPGQGSQYVGMGSDFYKKYDSAKKTFEIVDKTLGFSLTNIILCVLFYFQVKVLNM